MGNTPHNENPDRGSIQLQAGLGRPAIYKKRPVVDAALGLRDLGRRTIHKKEDAALGLRDLGRRTIHKKVDAAPGLRDLGRRTIHKKVDAALGLRDLGRRTIHKKEDAAPGLRKGRGLRVEIRIHIQPRQKRKKRQEKHL